LNEFFTRNTLLQTKDKIHETGGKTGSYNYKNQSFRVKERKKEKGKQAKKMGSIRLVQ